MLHRDGSVFCVIMYFIYKNLKFPFLFNRSNLCVHCTHNTKDSIMQNKKFRNLNISGCIACWTSWQCPLTNWQMPTQTLVPIRIRSLPQQPTEIKKIQLKNGHRFESFFLKREHARYVTWISHQDYCVFLGKFCVCSEARAGNKDVERKLGKVRQVEH